MKRFHVLFLSGVLAVFTFTASPTWGAFVEGPAPVVLSDDFEEIVSSPDNLYEIDDSPVADGPWDGTSATSGNEYAVITARPDAQGGQAAAYRGKLSAQGSMEYNDLVNNAGPTEYFIDFEWLPEPNDRNRLGRGMFNRFQLADSNGARRVMQLAAAPVYPNNPAADAVDSDAFNELIVTTGDGDLNLGEISATEFSQIHLQLTPVDVANNGSWSYSLWVNGVLEVDGQTFTQITGNAAKANQVKFVSKWQDNALSYVDNFNIRTDGFATPIPEPGTLGLAAVGGALMLVRRKR